MGRKPNQVVLEFFDRGAKLENSSNRYEHRCKACGEHFPKGRIESLVAHIEKKCPSISREQIISDALPTHVFSHDTPIFNEDALGSLDQLTGHIPTESHILLPRRSLTGLEALAEASRQLEHPGKPVENSSRQIQLIDPDLEGTSSTSRQTGSNPSPGEAADFSAYPAADKDGSNVGFDSPTSASHGITEHSSTRGRASQDPAMLSLIAASATNLEAMMPRIGKDNHDQDNMAIPRSTASQQRIASEVVTTHTKNPTSTNAAANPTMPFPLDSSALPKPDLSLAHPGSMGAPKIPNRAGSGRHHGRAQKIREIFNTHITRDFTPLMARSQAPGPFQFLSSRLLERWNDQGASQSGRCFVRIAYATSEPDPMILPAQLHGHQMEGKLERCDTNEELSDGTAVSLDETMEQTASHLLPHMLATISRSNYEDSGPLIGPTLDLASRLIRERNDYLLAQTLDLWAFVQVLVSNPADWRLLPDPPGAQDEGTRQPLSNTEVSGGPGALSSGSLKCVTAQLQAAAERQISTISKNIMIDLERRLERKERCQGFETFLIGIILLNCIERMCWVFRRISDDVNDVDWPLEKPVEYYLDQAARFADFLSRLYKMRGILVQVHQKSEDEMLQTSPTAAPLATKWLGELNLSSELRRIRLRYDEEAQLRIDDRVNERREADMQNSMVSTQQMPPARPATVVPVFSYQFSTFLDQIISSLRYWRRFDGVIKKLHYEAEEMAQVGKPLCDIDVLSAVSPENEAALGSDPQQAGSPSAPQQPQKVAEQHQIQQDQSVPPRDEPNPPSSGKHSSLATPAVRGLLKELDIDISEVTGTGKDGRVLKEDVQNHATSRSATSNTQPLFSPGTSSTKQTETPITLTPIQSQMFKTMTRSLSVPHFLYADELDITALSRLRTHLNQNPHRLPPADQSQHPKLSYLPFIIKALSLTLHKHPLLNSRVDTSTSRPRLILRSEHHIGVAVDTPQGLIVPNIKSVNSKSIPEIAAELARLHALALASKLTANDLTGGTITVSNIGSIGGTYVSPIIASESEVAILGVGKKRVVPAFSDDDGAGEVVRRKEVMHFSWSADHRVVDGASVAKCAEGVRGLVEVPERMMLWMR
ncbi:MAG: hypothetical protein Q9219_000461 [cf. Caloplaca sp. 3 TL-2023]